MNIKNQIPHSSDSKAEGSILAPLNLQGNPTIWRRIANWYLVASWFPFKWSIFGIYVMFGNDVPIPAEVKALVEKGRAPSPGGWMQNEVEKYHRFIRAVQTLEETEPLSPAMKIVLNEALNVTGSALCSVRDMQDEREGWEAGSEEGNPIPEFQFTDEEMAELMRPDPDDPTFSVS